MKDFTIREKLSFQICAEAANVTNARTWGNLGTNMSNPVTFGVIQDGGSARTIQVGARLKF
jgi:hypothetical protein